MKNRNVKMAGLKIAMGLCAGLIFGQQALALATLLGDPEQGGVVLDANCSGCHVGMYGGDGSEIYTRPDHRVQTVEGLMQQVEICNVNALKGALSADQLDDITAHLNETYYKYDD